MDLTAPEIGAFVEVAAPGGPGGVASSAGADPSVRLLNASADSLPKSSPLTNISET